MCDVINTHSYYLQNILISQIMYKLILIKIFLIIPIFNFGNLPIIKAGGLKDLYDTSVLRTCTIESSSHLRIVNKNTIDQFRYCIISNILYEITLWKRSSRKPTLRKLGEIGSIVNVVGKVSTETGRLTQKAMQRQYELEDGNIILYECTINNCAKKIISRKTVAYPVDTIQN